VAEIFPDEDAQDDTAKRQHNPDGHQIGIDPRIKQAHEKGMRRRNTYPASATIETGMVNSRLSIQATNFPVGSIGRATGALRWFGGSSSPNEAQQNSQ
jgi:hypothetical protein